MKASHAVAAPDTYLLTSIRQDGFAFVPAGAMRELLETSGSLADWHAFAESWNDLEVDTYMADRGRYRRRRHAAYAVTADRTVHRKPHQAHYQGLDYNRLHGGVQRWFEPVRPEIGDGPTMQTLLGFCHALFGKLKPVPEWHVEVHQFRIEAGRGQPGKPTPEGSHRDGVDYVLVLMIQRRNIASGTTSIEDLGHQPLGSFTLTRPFDAALVDDARVFHGVTPVEPEDPAKPAYRDVLVMTFRAGNR